MTWERPFQPSQAASFSWDSCGETLWSSQLSELCAILKTKVSSWFLISALRLFSYMRRFSLFIYPGFPQCWFRSGPPRRIRKSWLFHSGIVVSVSTLPVHSVIWNHLCLRVRCLLHTVVAVEGWGELSSISQTDASQWGEAVGTEALVLVTFTSGNEGDKRAGWRLTSTVPVLASDPVTRKHLWRDRGGYCFSLSYFKVQFVFYNKKLGRIKKGQNYFFFFPLLWEFCRISW